MTRSKIRSRRGSIGAATFTVEIRPARPQLVLDAQTLGDLVPRQVRPGRHVPAARSTSDLPRSAAEDFATKLRRRKRTPGPELDHILKLQVGWSVDDIVAAIEHAAKYDAFDARAIERILEARFRPRRLAEQIADATRNQIRDAMRGHPIEQRALSSYETLRLGDRFLREPREEDARDQADDETDPG